MMIGRDIEVSPTDPVTLADGRPYYVAVYTTDQLTLGSIVVLDLNAAGNLGGAIGLLPAGGIKDAIADKSLPASAVDNLYEILNVASSLFNADGSPHLKLYQLYEPGDPIPADVAVTIPSPGRRLDLLVSIPGYGAGRIGLIAAL